LPAHTSGNEKKEAVHHDIHECNPFNLAMPFLNACIQKQIFNLTLITYKAWRWALPNIYFKIPMIQGESKGLPKSHNRTSEMKSPFQFSLEKSSAQVTVTDIKFCTGQA